MIINPTKKALPIFSKLPKVGDREAGKQESGDYPFFSWTANYFNFDRKKIVVLINELTYSPVVLVDMNAENKKHISEFFKEGLRLTMAQADVDSKYVNHYLIKMGQIRVNAAANKSILGKLGQYIFQLKVAISYSDYDINDQRLAEKMTNHLAQLIVRGGENGDYRRTSEALRTSVTQYLAS